MSSSQSASVKLDVFKRKAIDLSLQENSVYTAKVPANCTNRLHPMHLRVNIQVSKGVHVNLKEMHKIQLSFQASQIGKIPLDKMRDFIYGSAVYLTTWQVDMNISS